MLCGMPMRSDRRRVPARAFAISVASLAIPVAAAFWFPDWTNNGLGMLIWLTALIPAFLLSYYRGLMGVAIALAGGMAVITATQISVVAFQIGEPDWKLLIAIVIVYLGVSIGIGGLAEVLRRERRVAEDLALGDRLTGLPNRRHADLALEREFAAAERGGEFAVVLFDLDHFKSVNDRWGHAVGDRTLKAFAKVLLKHTRKENVCARFGGEEFIVILRGVSADGAVTFAQRVVDQMRDTKLAWGRQTVSAGVAVYEKGMGSYEFLVGAADRALYQSKSGGRNMVSIATPQDKKPTGPSRRVSGGARVAARVREAWHPAPKVYLIDDDASVRSVLKRMLAKAGYDMWDTDDPMEAIRHFAESSPSERPGVILTDVIMPQMSGMRMIDQIAQIDPNIRVVYMSGYVRSKVDWEGTTGSVVAFLEKPIEREKLLATIDGVLAKEIGVGLTAATVS